MVYVPASPFLVTAHGPPSALLPFIPLVPFIPLLPLGTDTEVPSVQLMTAPPSVAVTVQEVPADPGCPPAPLLPEQPARRSAASAAKGTDARIRMTLDMNHLVFRRPAGG